MSVQEARIIEAISPQAEVARAPRGAILTVRDKRGETTALIKDGEVMSDRVATLNATLLEGSSVIEAVGIPMYVDNVSEYAAYGITETGWYVFARISAPIGEKVTVHTTVTGAAGYIAVADNMFVDVAVRFGVAAVSQTVTVDWGTVEETFVFKATDLAVDRIWDYITETPAQGERF